MISMKLSGIRMFNRELMARVQLGTVAPLRRCAILVENEAKMSMKEGGGASHTPSPAGTPPHVQWGDLRISITHAAFSTGGKPGQIVGPTEIYGKFHEYGTRTHPVRAFMRPALTRMQMKFPGEFKDII